MHVDKLVRTKTNQKPHDCTFEALEATPLYIKMNKIWTSTTAPTLDTFEQSIQMKEEELGSLKIQERATQDQLLRLGAVFDQQSADFVEIKAACDLVS